MMSSDSYYRTEATNCWAEKYLHAKWGTDIPSVNVWMPTSVPSARLETVAHGCDEPDTLPSGPAVAYVSISGVSIGGYLEDLELLFAAVNEQLQNVRGYHDELRAKQS